MFTIKSIQALKWPAIPFALKKGDNNFESAAAIKVEAREKLLRFRERGFVEFDVPSGWDPNAKPEPKAKAPKTEPSAPSA